MLAYGLIFDTKSDASADQTKKADQNAYNRTSIADDKDQNVNRIACSRPIHASLKAAYAK